MVLLNFKNNDENAVLDDAVLSLERLTTWIEGNGWAGYDPYDVKESWPYELIGKLKYPRLVFERLVLERHPVAIRKLFFVKKRIVPKAMGLFAHGFADLFQLFDDRSYLDRSASCLNWLSNNMSSGHSGNCWGYPFDWASRIFIPHGTPSGVATTAVADGFYQASRIKSKYQNNWLEIAKNCVPFYVNDLNRYHDDQGNICFSYTPIDNFQIHNANLFIAKQLMRFGILSNNTEHINLAENAVDYTLTHQQSNGSWFYWGPPSNLTFSIDHYHTGFVLRTLHDIYLMTKEPKHLRAIKNGLDFYMENFFDRDGAPKLYVPKRFPIDIHSCAEAIICLSELRVTFPDCASLLLNTTKWTLKNMQSGSGYFYYLFKESYISKIPFIRWGQAWMLRALTAFVKSMTKEIH